jgi:hypothetical protein
MPEPDRRLIADLPAPAASASVRLRRELLAATLVLTEK